MPYSGCLLMLRTIDLLLHFDRRRLTTVFIHESVVGGNR